MADSGSGSGSFTEMREANRSSNRESRLSLLLGAENQSVSLPSAESEYQSSSAGAFAAGAYQLLAATDGESGMGLAVGSADPLNQSSSVAVGDSSEPAAKGAAATGTVSEEIGAAFGCRPSSFSTSYRTTRRISLTSASKP